MPGPATTASRVPAFDRMSEETQTTMVTGRIPVVYVAGSGHTGSTLLALLLDSHPEICCVGETSIKPPIVQSGAKAASRTLRPPA